MSNSSKLAIQFIKDFELTEPLPEFDIEDDIVFLEWEIANDRRLALGFSNSNRIDMIYRIEGANGALHLECNPNNFEMIREKIKQVQGKR